MAEPWNEFDGAMQEAAAGLLRAAEGLHQAIDADQRLRAGQPRSGDLREIVAQLEKLVLELQTEIRTLLDRLNRN